MSRFDGYLISPKPNKKIKECGVLLFDKNTEKKSFVRLEKAL